MKIAVFDIETIPNQSLPEGVTPEFDPLTVKHGNTKDQAKRDAKEDAEQAKFDQALGKKMSLHPDLCEVVAFCGMIYDTTSGEHEDTIVSGEPQAVLSTWKFIYDAYHHTIPLVSFSGNGFDLPVLLHRAMDLQIPMSRRIYSDLTRRYSTKSHYDLMQVLADWDKQRWESLDFYLNRYGIGAKSGHGSQVYGWWKEGEIKRIEEYCVQDVLSTAKLFARLEGWIVPGIGVDDA